MNEQRQDRKAELRWVSERESKKSDFLNRISSIIALEFVEILDSQESDELMKDQDNWPGSTPSFIFQTPKNNRNSITEVIQKLADYIQGGHVLIFMMNLNFGHVKLPKSELIEHWNEIIELDGDEFFIYDPNDSYFVCVELTEGFLPNSSQQEWIYELTFSTKELKNKLLEE